MPSIETPNDPIAELVAREHARAERRLNEVRGGVLLVLAIAAAFYSPRLTRALDAVNMAILAPMLTWTIGQHVYVHTRRTRAAWLSTVNPIVDISAVTVLLLGYGLVGLPDLAVKSPIFLAYFGILAARPFTSSTRRAGAAAATAMLEYGALAAFFLVSGRLGLHWSPLDTLSSAGTSVLDEGAKVLLLGVAGAIATYATAWNENILRRALAAQVERSEEEHALAIRLQEADKLAALGALSATMAHEVNNPLASILAVAQLLRESELTDEQRADVDAVISEARRTANVVRDMLRAARPTGSALENLSLGAVVTNVLGVARPLARSRRVTVDQSMPEEIPPVRGQAGRLEQVVLNLVVNAMQAIEEHGAEGEVLVRVWSDAARVHVAVEDSGPGLPPGVADRIFERFFTTKPVGKGTGLGLWIAKQIITEHGGTISASNRASRGACIAIALPRCDVYEGGSRIVVRGSRADESESLIPDRGSRTLQTQSR
ncbi:MAG: ATP-binding protein [Gemmatimonadaceae bacterium]